jgi:hypothetical protein
MPKTTSPQSEPKPAAEEADVVRRSGPRAPVLTAVLIVAGLLLAAGGWWAYHSLAAPADGGPDRSELAAIDARLTAIRQGIQPVADALASQTATASAGAIDVAGYRNDLLRVRDLVDATNDLAATSAEALEIRDLVLTGGSQVVAGMQETLNAMVANDPNAVQAAAAHVEEGLGNLQDARRRLDVLLGRAQSA